MHRFNYSDRRYSCIVCLHGRSFSCGCSLNQCCCWSCWGQTACECGYEKKDLEHSHVTKEKQNEYNDGVAKAIAINAGFGAAAGALVVIANAGVDKCLAAPHANAVHPARAAIQMQPVAVVPAVVEAGVGPAAAVMPAAVGGAGYSAKAAKIVVNGVVAPVNRVCEKVIKDVT